MLNELKWQTKFQTTPKDMFVFAGASIRSE